MERLCQTLRRSNVAGEDDQRQAGPAALRTKAPGRYAGQQLTHDDGSAHIQAAGRDIPGRATALHQQVARLDLERVQDGGDACANPGCRAFDVAAGRVEDHVITVREKAGDGCRGLTGRLCQVGGSLQGVDAEPDASDARQSEGAFELGTGPLDVGAHEREAARVAGHLQIVSAEKGTGFHAGANSREG
jgi:hypothetical protein